MENSFFFGFDLILALQSLGNWLEIPMSLLSFLGSEQFFLLLAPILYWCIDPIFGLRFGLALIINSIVNNFFKQLFHTPRPYWTNKDVTAYTSESGFGLPSGHAESAVVVWGTLAIYIRKNWFNILAVVLILLISLSRIYLGMHFIGDIVAGWFFGGLVLWGFHKVEKPVFSWIKEQNFSIQTTAIVSFSLLLTFSGVILRALPIDWQLPTEWIETAALATSDGDPIDPYNLDPYFSMGGAFFGMAFGALLLARRGWFNVKGTWGQYAGRYFIGLIGTVILWMGLGEVFPRGDNILSFALRYFRYSLTSLWITFLAPMIFIRLKIADKSDQASMIPPPKQTSPS